MSIATTEGSFDYPLTTWIPATSGGVLRREGSGWRFESDREQVFWKVVSPGTVTVVRVDPTFDRPVAEALVGSLRLVDAPTWTAPPGG